MFIQDITSFINSEYDVKCECCMLLRDVAPLLFTADYSKEFINYNPDDQEFTGFKPATHRTRVELFTTVLLSLQVLK